MKKMKIMRSYTLQAAHHLPRVPEGHKCGRVHGHTYKVEVWVEGVDNGLGWFMDFASMDVVYNELIHNHLDHRDLNDFIDNPTTENLCEYIGARLGVAVAGLCKLVIRENEYSAVEWMP
jgi:6-pyruvoyltetrahydropterin/6-carboxytetrahydropterin synthase